MIKPMWKMGDRTICTQQSVQRGLKGGLERLITAKLTASLGINGYTNLIHDNDPFLNLAENSLYQSVTSCPDILELIAAAWRQNTSPAALMAS